MKNYISQNIKYLCIENNLQYTEFAEIVDAGRSVVSMWVAGKSSPKIDAIQKICEYFKISIDDFINRDLSKVKPVARDYYTDPVISELAKEPAGSMASAGWVGIVETLRANLEDKDKIIEMLEKEVRRLNSEIGYGGKRKAN